MTSFNDEQSNKNSSSMSYSSETSGIAPKDKKTKSTDKEDCKVWKTMVLQNIDADIRQDLRELELYLNNIKGESQESNDEDERWFREFIRKIDVFLEEDDKEYAEAVKAHRENIKRRDEAVSKFNSSMEGCRRMLGRDLLNRSLD